MGGWVGVSATGKEPSSAMASRKRCNIKVSSRCMSILPVIFGMFPEREDVILEEVSSGQALCASLNWMLYFLFSNYLVPP